MRTDLSILNIAFFPSSMAIHSPEVWPLNSKIFVDSFINCCANEWIHLHIPRDTSWEERVHGMCEISWLALTCPPILLARSVRVITHSCCRWCISRSVEMRGRLLWYQRSTNAVIKEAPTSVVVPKGHAWGAHASKSIRKEGHLSKPRAKPIRIPSNLSEKDHQPVWNNYG